MTEHAEKPVELQQDGVIIHKSDTLEQYSEKVNKIKDYIREGHIFQTVLSQRWTIETEQEGFSLYRELKELNPSPYLYYFNFGTFEVIGSSPEMIVKQQGKRVFTCPIAGTRPRGKTTEEDEALKKELLSDEKEKAEHVMLVDLARNDMGRISEFGTVKVTDFMNVQKYSHVMHIVSMVEGRKKGEFHPLSYAKELFHGKQSEITHDGQGIFKGIDSPVKVARYHSLAVQKESLPECLVVTAETEDGEIMAVRHKKYPVYGLQFHPESIYTEHGKRMIENFLGRTA